MFSPHMGKPNWDLCEMGGQKELGPMWAAHVGPTKQPTNDPVSTQFQHTESPLKKGTKHT